MAKTESVSKEKPADVTPDSKFVSAAKSFAIVATATVIPAALTSLWVIPQNTIPDVFFNGGWTLFSGLVTYHLADAQVGPKIEQGLSKKTVFAGFFTGLAAAGLLTWQLNAGDAKQQPVAPAHPSAAELTLMPHMKPVTAPKLTYPVYAQPAK